MRVNNVNAYKNKRSYSLQHKQFFFGASVIVLISVFFSLWIRFHNTVIVDSCALLQKYCDTFGTRRSNKLSAFAAFVMDFDFSFSVHDKFHDKY